MVELLLDDGTACHESRPGRDAVRPGRFPRARPEHLEAVARASRLRRSRAVRHAGVFRADWTRRVFADRDGPARRSHRRLDLCRYAIAGWRSRLARATAS